MTSLCKQFCIELDGQEESGTGFYIASSGLCTHCCTCGHVYSGEDFVLFIE